MFWCLYDRDLQSLRYVNAGHCPPFLVGRRNGILTIRRLTEGGPVLGLLPQATYVAAAVDIEPSDLLVMYTDSLVEATDEEDEQYGEERLALLLDSHFCETPSQLQETLMASWKHSHL